ncbi:MAG: hypothetical protein RL033_7486 [Pseudomonadota bacterium]
MVGSAAAPLLAVMMACVPGAPVPTSAGAQPAVPKPPSEQRELVQPCRIDGPEHAAASAEVARIDAAVGALAVDGDPAPIVEALLALGKSPCFEIGGRLSFDGGEDERPDSALSLRDFWLAGKEFVEGYLNLAGLPRANATLWTRPRFRKTWSRESAVGDARRSLLCSVRDAACIASTGAFRLRAEGWLALDAERARLARGGEAIRTKSCSDGLEDVVPDARLGVWLDCLESERDEELALPLVGAGKPVRGWLLLSGRRGHYEFCDEVRAYNLASGAAYGVGSCSHLSLVAGGSVDQRATDSARRIETSLGFIPPLALQEALWFLLEAPELRRQVSSVGWSVPKGMRPVRYVSDGEGMSMEGISVCTSSGDTGVSWKYVLDGAVAASGELTWPGCGWNPQNQYAVQLVQVAEALFEPRCQGAPAPEVLKQITLELAPDGIDVDAASARQASDQVAEVWKRIGHSGPDCAKPSLP